MPCPGDVFLRLTYTTDHGQQPPYDLAKTTSSATPGSSSRKYLTTASTAGLERFSLSKSAAPTSAESPVLSTGPHGWSELAAVLTRFLIGLASVGRALAFSLSSGSAAVIHQVDLAFSLRLKPHQSQPDTAVPTRSLHPERTLNGNSVGQ